MVVIVLDRPIACHRLTGRPDFEQRFLNVDLGSMWTMCSRSRSWPSGCASIVTVPPRLHPGRASGRALAGWQFIGESPVVVCPHYRPALLGRRGPRNGSLCHVQRSGGKRRPTDAMARRAVNDLKDAVKTSPCASAKQVAKAKAVIKTLTCDVKAPQGQYCPE